MYRFLLRPRWILLTLGVAALVVLMINLGFWQLRRLDERQAFNQLVTSRAEQATVPVSDVLSPTTDGRDVDWVPVVASGTYEPDETVLVVNRSQQGQAGVNVVTPLRLADGSLLLVNRGFVPDRAEVPDAPTGTITVEGQLRASQQRGFGGARDPAEGDLTEVQRIDIPRLRAQLDGEVLPAWLSRTASDPAEGDVPWPLPEPELTNGPHLSYAVQWFLFSAAAIVGWVILVRRAARKRLIESRATPPAAGGPGSPGEPEPATAPAGAPPTSPG